VQWDSIPPNTLTQLERVCPWWIEPLESPKIKGFPTLPLSNEGKFFYIHFSNLRCFDIKFLAFPNIYMFTISIETVEFSCYQLLGVHPHLKITLWISRCKVKNITILEMLKNPSSLLLSLYYFAVLHL
jgi:hypothetical protein